MFIYFQKVWLVLLHFFDVYYIYKSIMYYRYRKVWRLLCSLVFYCFFVPSNMDIFLEQLLVLFTLIRICFFFFQICSKLNENFGTCISYRFQEHIKPIIEYISVFLEAFVYCFIENIMENFLIFKWYYYISNT